jgi:thiol:disulfide interchange protein DsbC
MKRLFITAQIALMSALFVGALSVASSTYAEEENKDIATIKAAIASLGLKDKPEKIIPSAVPGLYEVLVGQYVLYVSGDGKYMLQGDLYDVQRRVNLTDEIRSENRVKAMRALDEDSMIIFSPADGKAKFTITAFTDIDCGYCRKLHKEMQQYNELGIEVRYVSYPRAGLNSPSYEKAVAVWCAVDRNKAMTTAKSGASLNQLKEVEQVKDKSCKDPIKEHMKIANLVGVTGTPTLVMEDGSVLPGYVPADRLYQELEKHAKSQKSNKEG